MLTAGTGATRNPMFLAFPATMLVSTVVTGLAGRPRRQGGSVDADRDQYLSYLSGLSRSVSEIAVAQYRSAICRNPDPDMLWTLIGGPRMWERRPTDADFGVVRVGMGTQPLARRLVAPQLPSEKHRDPVTAMALKRFLYAHSTVRAPVTIGLRAETRLTIDGDRGEVRGMLRAILCQLAVLHPPEQVLIVAAVDEENRGHWDWLKWLPHNQHPVDVDDAGPVRMIYPSATEAQRALAAVQGPEAVVVTDLASDVDPIVGGATIGVGTGRDGAPLMIRAPADPAPGWCPDRMAPLDALICARRLAGYHPSMARPGRAEPNWPQLMGLYEPDRPDPVALWRRRRDRDRLRVPIGTTDGGTPLELDIKEPAEDGMGPHGLCIGATGSGKSELLRTIALGMMAHNPPDTLNLLLIDFKGGATFRDYAQAPHVAAVITNLADDAPLVARMRDALSGEMNRRQQLLRTAGCASVAAYERARGVRTLRPLPTLFIVVDEFSELLSQHPDFADTFAAIGRLGRSLGMHLLLASQRLDEGRLRGLEAHLSYRMCLKTLSANESQTVLGSLEAYRLPSAPGAGFLRIGGGEPIRFQAALVSAPLPTNTSTGGQAVAARTVQVFGTWVTGAVSRAAQVSEAPERTISSAVLDRLTGKGPPAHRVWLPPLGRAPALHTVLADVACAPGGLTVPIGIVDRPFDQCRTPLVVDLSGAAGNLAVIGAPQSGKSTALRTLITALAATHRPRQVQFYCLDFGGGSLSAVRTLPHVGAVAGRAQPRLVGRIVAECESVVRRREALFREQGIASIAEHRQRRRDIVHPVIRSVTCSSSSTDGRACAKNSTRWRSRSPRWRLRGFRTACTWCCPHRGGPRCGRHCGIRSAPASSCGWVIPPTPKSTAGRRAMFHVTARVVAFPVRACTW
jgi:S-DNA-T family DNA segregation ATPase FtsK/SpoIIIE